MKAGKDIRFAVIASFVIYLILLFIAIFSYRNLNKKYENVSYESKTWEKAYNSLSKEYTEYKYDTENELERLNAKVEELKNEVIELQEMNDVLKEDNLHMRLLLDQ